jgi:hypothetical protein
MFAVYDSNVSLYVAIQPRMNVMSYSCLYLLLFALAVHCGDVVFDDVVNMVDSLIDILDNVRWFMRRVFM